MAVRRGEGWPEAPRRARLLEKWRREVDRRGFLRGGAALTLFAGVTGGASLMGALRAQEPASQEPLVYVCPLHPDVQAKAPGHCQKCNTRLVATSATASGAPEFYTCPMHADVIAGTAGLCPKCNMKLIKGAPPETEEFQVRIETSPSPPRAGEDLKMRFRVFHPTTREQVKTFNILHDMPFHLFVVSQDFTSFDHIHPELLPDGSFEIVTRLPREGYYKVFCDFFPGGGMPQVTHHHLITAGFKGDLASSTARLQPERPVDGRLVRTIDGTRFELTFEPFPLYSGEEFELHYRLIDEKSGQPVRDLRPYLAAWGHTLILSEDGTDYLHSHPTEMLPEGMSEEEKRRLAATSEVTFDTFFPRPGRYRIWSQFQRADQILTVPFTIEVPRLS